MTTTKKENFFHKLGKGTKQFFQKIGNAFKKKFKYMTPLVMMQLKDKIEFSATKEKKKIFFKIVWNIILFILITAIITFLFELIIKFGLFSFVQTFNFQAFLALMSVLFILSFISCLINVTTTLYFSKDNPVLLTMPVKNSTIFTSKLIVCFIYELIKNISYMFPFFIAYGVVMNLAVAYYFWILLGLVFLTLLFIVVAGLLSIPAMIISIILKKHRIVEFALAFVFICGVVTAIVFAIINIPSDIDLVRDWGRIYWQIQDGLNLFAVIFAPFDYLLQLLTGMSYNSYVFTPFSITNTITFFVCLGIIAISFVSIYLLSKPLFLKMASTPFEYKKKTIKKLHKNKTRKAFASSIHQHSKQIFRTSNLLYGILAIAIATPIAILLQNQIVSAMDTRLAGQYMGIAFNILIVLMMLLSSNVTLSSVFSREGNSAYLNKVNPVPYKIPLTGKLVLNASICILSIIISTIVITLYAKLTAMQTILLMFSLGFLYIAHLLWSAELDIMNPQNRQYQTTGKNQKNPNETKSTIIGFLLSAIFAFVAYFLMSENINNVFTKLFFITLIILLARIYLYLTKIKLYYKEK